MGNRAECPVCGAYSSGVYSALCQSNKCPYCEAPHDILQKWNSLKDTLEEYQVKRISKDLLEKVQEFDQCLSKAFGEMDMIKNKIPIFRSILKTYTCRDCSHQFEIPRGYPIVDHPFCPKCNPLKLKPSEESPV